MKTLGGKARQRGVTLIELVVTIVVIGIGVAGILLVLDRNTRESGRPVIEHQAIAIAEAYLEEILAKPFCDPDGATCEPGNAPGSLNCQVCPPTPPAETSRANYDNVCDYNGLNDNGARSQSNPGIAVAGLEAYNVQVQVGAGAVLNGLAGGSCQLLDVTVNVAGPFGVSVALSGYRANY